MRNIQRDISGSQDKWHRCVAGFHVTTLTIANPLAHLLGHRCCYQTTIIRLYAYTRNDTLGISIVGRCKLSVGKNMGSWVLEVPSYIPNRS
jgi:hypothetical protein